MFPSLWRRKGLTGFLGMVRRSPDGRDNRTSHSGMVCLDVHPSSSEISVLSVQDRIPAGSGIWSIPCPLLGLNFNDLDLTKRELHPDSREQRETNVRLMRQISP